MIIFLAVVQYRNRFSRFLYRKMASTAIKTLQYFSGTLRSLSIYLSISPAPQVITLNNRCTWVWKHCFGFILILLVLLALQEPLVSTTVWFESWKSLKFYFYLMDKDVFSWVIASYESEAFHQVEPFDRARNNAFSGLLLIWFWSIKEIISKRRALKLVLFHSNVVVFFPFAKLEVTHNKIYCRRNLPVVSCTS